MNNEYQVGIYLRLSKEDEKTGESGSITNQRAILMNYIKEHNLTYVKEYVDDGVSGTTFNRVGFNQMIRDIESKKINMIITKDTSRLGRDHIEFGYYVEKFFPEHNVRYVAVCDNIDTVFNSNDMLLFKSAYNDMYVKDISNKIRASLNIKKRNGEFVGAYAPYGYQKNPENKHQLIIDEPSALIVKRIFKMFIQGNSISKIAITLTEDKIPIPSIYKNMNRGLKSSLFGIWTPRTLTDILTNPTYIGNLTQGRSKKVNYKSKKRIHTKQENWISVTNACPAIIDKSTFELAQNIFQTNKYQKHHPSRNLKNIKLKGLVYCEECGHKIGFRVVYQSTKHHGLTEHIYGNCNYYLKKKRYHACTPHSIRYIELERIIMQKIKELTSFIDQKALYQIIYQKELKQSTSSELKKEATKLEKELEFNQKKIDLLYEDKLNGVINQERYLRMEKKIQEEQLIQKKRLAELKKEQATLKTINYQEYFEKIYQKYIEESIFIASLIDKITIHENGNIHVYYKIDSVL